MAARDTGLGAVEQFMHQGKLLALDLLTHVFNDPGHNWSLSRPLVRQAFFWTSSDDCAVSELVLVSQMSPGRAGPSPSPWCV